MYLQRLLVPAGLVVVAFAAIVSPASAKQPECQAINQSQDVAYNSNNTASPLGTAIAEAASGDTIKVMGTCYGNFAITKDLTLRGRSSDQHEDVINGGGSGTVLDTFASRLTVVDLTITGGATGVSNFMAPVTLIRTTVTGNQGTGIQNTFFGSTLTVEDSTISDNTGLGIGNGRGSVSISNSRLTGNSGGGFGATHGGLQITGSVIAWNSGLGGVSTGDSGGVISNSVIEGNTSDGRGGGINGYQHVEVTGSTIRGNTAIQGGGIYNPLGSRLVITDSAITGNHAIGGPSYPGNGGGIYTEGVDVSLTDSFVTGNTATAAGGGIFLYSGTVTTSGTNSLCGNTPDDWPGCLP